jgi:fructuronate reductase
VDDTLEVAEFPAGLRAASFAHEALRRFANPALGHTCAQVGADGSVKLPQRLLPVVTARKGRALDTMGFAVVAAIWIAATAGVAVRGVDLPQLEDPIAGALRAAARRNDPRELSHVALGSLAGREFTAEVAAALQRLTTEGLGLLKSER